MKKQNLFVSLITIATLCIIIIAVTVFFVYDKQFIGLILIGLGLIVLLPLKLFDVSIKAVEPDVIFGLIDNSFLAIFALIGADLAGIFGAIVGGLVGNTVTDGVAGIFEGYSAERLRKNGIADNRTVLSAAVGKMAGCLFGAGIVLFLAWLIGVF